jgi:hypothetical protein
MNPRQPENPSGRRFVSTAWFGVFIWQLLQNLISKDTWMENWNYRRRLVSLRARMFHLQLLKRRNDLRIIINRTRVICLKRRYLFPEKGDLISDSWFARAGIYHPIEVVKVFLECSHRYFGHPISPNDQGERPAPSQPTTEERNSR